MTISVGVACPEGLVLAADSRTTTISGKNHMRIATDYARKVFPIDESCAAATYGWAYIEDKTIAGHMAEFVFQESVEAKQWAEEDPPRFRFVHDVAASLEQFFRDTIQSGVAAGTNPAPSPGENPLAFIVAGNDKHGNGRLISIDLPFGSATDRFGTNSGGGVLWGGQLDVINRLIRGWDITRLDPSRWAKRSRDALDGVGYLTPFGRYALQDAIDFAAFVVRTTIDTQRFTDGTVADPGEWPGCGGPMQILAIDWEHGLQWVQQTTLKAAASLGRGEGTPA